MPSRTAATDGSLIQRISGSPPGSPKCAYIRPPSIRVCPVFFQRIYCQKPPLWQLF